MVNKHCPTIKLLVFIFCFFVLAGKGLVYAQNFSQTLQWNSDPNVLEYKVEIQDSFGKIISSEITENNSVKLSLKEGRYKYKITAYDMLGRESVSTNWVGFEVLIANQPAIVHNNNLEALQEDGKTLELNLDIDDVTTDTIAELVNIADGTRVAGKLVLATAAGAPAVGLSASESYKATKALFTDIPEGKWKLVITNPSGLSSESEVFEVKDIIKEQKLLALKLEEERKAKEQAEREEAERKAAELEAERLAREEEERIAIEQERLAREEEERLAREEEERIALEEERLAREEEERIAKEEEEAEKEEEKKKRKEAWKNYDRKFYIAAGGGLILPVYDEGFFNDDIIKKNYLTPGLTAQIGILPFHTQRMRFGMEFNGYVTKFQKVNDVFNLNLNMYQIQDNLAIRFGTKNKKFWLQLKGGGGIVIIQETLDYYEKRENNIQNKTINYGYFTAGGGLSVIFTPGSMFMMELGADYYNLFITDANVGLLNPYLTIGVRF